VIICCLLFAAGSFAHAQSTFGSVRGNVLDASGSAIPDAQIVLHSTDENTERTVDTDTSGAFIFENVQAGKSSVANLYSEDEYVRAKWARSVLCLPIVNQTKVTGALNMENNLTLCAFPADRVAVLELLASLAAISLENARLYSDLQRSEAYLTQAQSMSHTGSFGWSVISGEIFWSEETYEIYLDSNEPLSQPMSMVEHWVCSFMPPPGGIYSS
jgi:GAF domain-containing protein